MMARLSDLQSIIAARLSRPRASLSSLFALRHDIGWLILGRLSVLGPLLLTVSMTICGGYSISCTNSVILLPLILVSAFSLLSIVWLQFRTPQRWFTYVQLLADVVFVTWVVFISGGPISPFLFLYLPVVMAAAILRSRNGALAVSAVSGTGYSLLGWAMLSGRISPLGLSQPIVEPTGGLLIQVLGLLSAMALIAVATSFLIRKINHGHKLVEESQHELDELSSRQKLLIDGIPEGVITTDLNQAITTINEAAQALFSISEAQSLGQDLRTALKGLGDAIKPEEALIAGQREITIESKDEDNPIHVTYHGRPLVDKGGNPIGKVYVFQDVTKLRSIEQQLKMQEHMSRLLADPGEVATNSVSSHGIVGETPVIKQVIKLVERVAKTDATVLITGESGTGKEVIARAIHKGSTRAGGSFVAVNCGAIPENLIESQLFGHKKGSFTSADSDSTGLFRQAEGGTIFLDEIAELPIHMQSKLLRVTQERVVRPIGGDSDIPIDVRIVSATNKVLKDEVQKGNFREDLYYRLNVISLKLPPLRQRKEDIPLLVNVILRRFLEKTEEAIVSPQAMQLLLSYDYPGNVRELENILERALVLGGSVILPEHLPETVREFKAQSQLPQRETQIIISDDIQFPINLETILSTIERRYLEAALVKSEGGKKKAAELLGINFRSIRYRLDKFGL